MWWEEPDRSFVHSSVQQTGGGLIEYQPCTWFWDSQDLRNPHHKGVPSPGERKTCK